jgi:hypothetical protein
MPETEHIIVSTPGAMGVSKPVAVMLATEVLVTDQAAAGSPESCSMCPIQIVSGPDMVGV